MFCLHRSALKHRALMSYKSDKCTIVQLTTVMQQPHFRTPNAAITPRSDILFHRYRVTKRNMRYQ